MYRPLLTHTPDGKLKNYNLDTTTGADKTRDVGASSEFIQMPIAYDYKYRQGARTDFPDDKGTSSIQRIQAYQNYSIIAPDAESVPQGPSPDLPPETDLTPYVQSLIAQIRLELQKRPIITRHLLYNTLGWDKRDRLRQATVYCGYFFRTGPWREALITWGVDPRTDPSFRRYQTVSYLSYKKTGTARHHSEYDRHTRDLAAQSFEDLENQHIFDGIHVSFTGNLFQFCDITDPLLRGILDTDRIRETCAPTMQGWYHIGTWAKATVILKHKMNRILTHPDETPDNTLYARILTWPELWDDAELKAQYRSEFFDKKVNKEKREEHALMKQVMWATRSPRYAFERMEKAEDLAQRMQGELTTTGRNLAEAEEEEAEEDDEVEVDMTEEPDTAKKILDEGDDEDDADDADEDEDEDEADEADVGDDIDAEGETDDGEYAQPGPRAGDGDAPSSAVPQGPRPFGGLYDSV
jgi:general transcription factor 3C polypeptide 5 (transcription factor C subunit 1)